MFGSKRFWTTKPWVQLAMFTHYFLKAYKSVLKCTVETFNVVILRHGVLFVSEVTFPFKGPAGCCEKSSPVKTEGNSVYI